MNENSPLPAPPDGYVIKQMAEGTSLPPEAKFWVRHGGRRWISIKQYLWSYANDNFIYAVPDVPAPETAPETAPEVPAWLEAKLFKDKEAMPEFYAWARKEIPTEWHKWRAGDSCALPEHYWYAIPRTAPEPPEETTEDLSLRRQLEHADDYAKQATATIRELTAERDRLVIENRRAKELLRKTLGYVRIDGDAPNLADRIEDFLKSKAQ